MADEKVATVRMVTFGNVLVTRDRAREMLDELPECSQLTLDFERVGVASPSFLDELIRRVWERKVQSIQFVNTSAATNRNLERLVKVHPQDESKPPQRPNLEFPEEEMVG